MSLRIVHHRHHHLHRRLHHHRHRHRHQRLHRHLQLQRHAHSGRTAHVPVSRLAHVEVRSSRRPALLPAHGARGHVTPAHRTRCALTNAAASRRMGRVPVRGRHGRRVDVGLAHRAGAGAAELRAGRARRRHSGLSGARARGTGCRRGRQRARMDLWAGACVCQTRSGQRGLCVGVRAGNRAGTPRVGLTGARRKTVIQCRSGASGACVGVTTGRRVCRFVLTRVKTAGAVCLARRGRDGLGVSVTAHVCGRRRRAAARSLKRARRVRRGASGAAHVRGSGGGRRCVLTGLWRRGRVCRLRFGLHGQRVAVGRTRGHVVMSARRTVRLSFARRCSTRGESGKRGVSAM